MHQFCAGPSDPQVGRLTPSASKAPVSSQNAPYSPRRRRMRVRTAISGPGRALAAAGLSASRYERLGAKDIYSLACQRKCLTTASRWRIIPTIWRWQWQSWERK